MSHRAADLIQPVAALLLGCARLAACTLPQPDGVEAEIAARSAGLPALTPGESEDAGSVVRNGLLHHPGVREAASRVLASADEVRVQRAVLFPALGLSLGGGVGDAGRGEPALELSGRQMILDSGNARRAITSADIDLQINYIAFQKAVDDAVIEVLEAYDTVHMYDRLLVVRRNQLAAMRGLEGLVAERSAAGAAAVPDLLETRKRLQAAEFLVHDTDLMLAEARDRLARLGGQFRGGELPVLDSACTGPTVSDDLRMAQLRLVKADLDLERAERARQPRIFLSPIARHQSGQGGVGLGLNLGVDSDLLQGGALTARANAARNAGDGARAGVEAADRNADLDERALRRNIAAATRRTEMLNRQIALLTETRGLYRSQYFDLGTRQLSELLDNEEEFYNRQAELIELRSAQAMSRLECAARDRSLRDVMGLTGASLYGFPLTPEDI